MSFDIKNTIPSSHISTLKMKYLDINLINYGKYLCKNYKTLMKEIKEIEWFQCSSIGRHNILKFQFFPPWFIDSMQYSPKSSKLFMDIDKLMLKLMWRGKRPRIANLKSKENKVGRVTLSDFKTYYIATVIRIVRYWWMKI